jgi:hypothetical protein
MLTSPIKTAKVRLHPRIVRIIDHRRWKTDVGLRCAKRLCSSLISLCGRHVLDLTTFTHGNQGIHMAESSHHHFSPAIILALARAGL